MNHLQQQLSQIFLRMALSVSMLSAVADRFGYWGKNSSWGNWENFEKYCREITSFLPQALSTIGAYTATFLEIVLSILLLIGYKIKITSTAIGILLMLFALSMSLTLGIKSSFDYSVWIGSASAFLLVSQNHPLSYSMDKLNKK
ncbi:DoxX family protein [Elizabethkingia meningoseptica]|uniref:DoxX family protein n=1 Tax=Elizabethkingia meningoseptica TaxID=238 RepID=UPI0023AEDBA9|nr:DoxX family protein [Elizabethkingia meningoseptica]MDE5430244.1 DoxX family protein [Elizabethkingia meningoseptica]